MRTKTFLVLSLICYSLLLSAQTVTPWLTRGDGSTRLSQQATVSFGADAGASRSSIDVAAGSTYQTVDGFGFMLTQGSAQVILGLTPAKQDELLAELFGADGLAISMIRISIGASDLSNSSYTYNETPGDANMANFSLAGPDADHLIPVIKKIQAINPAIKVLATPWTAPTWMKSNGSYVGGTLLPAHYGAYARYFVKYLEAMDGLGIPIWGITPQNEPGNPYNNPSMLMSAAEQLDFVNNHLGPQLAASAFDPLIIGYDHNCDNTTYPTQVANGSAYVDGSAFHLYGGSIDAMSQVRNATNKSVYFTEQYTGTNGTFGGDFDWHMRNVVIGSLNNWSQTVLEWNLAADPDAGPHTDGGCTECLPAVTINSATGYTRNVSYYIIGQVAKFIRPGAVRLGLTSTDANITATAFQNPDGSRVVVAYNTSNRGVTVRLRDGGQSLNYSIDKKSAVSFVYTAGQPAAEQAPYGGMARTLPGTLEAEDFDTGGAEIAYRDLTPGNAGGTYRDTDVDVEPCSEGGFNIAYTDDGEWLEYSVDVAAAGNYDVSFRVATTNTTSALSLSVDGFDKTGSVSVPATGGYQNWQSVTVKDVALGGGAQVLRINILTGGFNLNALTVTESATPPPGATYYNILSRRSGKGLDVAGRSTRENAAVQQYDVVNDGGDNQQWQLVPVDATRYRIVARHSGMCLSLRRNSTANGIEVVQQTCSTEPRQQWELTDVGGGYVAVTNDYAGTVLDVKDASLSNGAAIQAWSYTGGTHQQWSLRQVGAVAAQSTGGSAVTYAAVAEWDRAMVYPSPVDQALTLRLVAPHDYREAQVIDATGRLLRRLALPEEATLTTLEVAGLVPGVYYLRLISAGGSRTLPFVKR